MTTKIKICGQGRGNTQNFSLIFTLDQAVMMSYKRWEDTNRGQDSRKLGEICIVFKGREMYNSSYQCSMCAVLLCATSFRNEDTRIQSC